MHQNKLNNKIASKVMRLPIIILFLSLITAQTGCKKLVEVDAPYTNLNGPFIFSGDGTAAAVLTGIYTTMSAGSFCINSDGLSIVGGLLSDELKVWDGAYDIDRLASINQNKLTSQQVGVDYVSIIYNTIYVANRSIEGLLSSTTLTPDIKNHLLGEAKFIRAFCYFYLVNLYGDVPMPTSSDWQKNSLLANTPKSEVYDQIVNDLKDAQGLLSDDYLGSDALQVSTERKRPNKGAATALLARVYLFRGDWVNSEIQASAVINDSARYHLTDLNSVFLRTSTEAIWQLQEMAYGDAIAEARLLVIPSTGFDQFGAHFYLFDFFVNSFEANDIRKTGWIGNTVLNGIPYYYPYKYKNITGDNSILENTTVMRLAEQYLIRAEARAQQGNTTDAASDLNAIRNRAGLPNTTATSQSELLDAILDEKRHEFFVEWGHRWFDLKRTNKIDEVMNVATPLKGGDAWQTHEQLLPFTYFTLQKAPNMKQNPGY